ncbi:unnamed protein product [Toxocara canis]|uniref:Transmembrane protein n=1 Tax=Toxocara canis TaxID=6265 RepID=A0A183VEL8_TOXCA|nr:unnamed protein product [Toxocara canis]
MLPQRGEIFCVDLCAGAMSCASAFLLSLVIIYRGARDLSSFLLTACMGRLFLASCQSQTFEVENEVTVQRIKEKELESEEEDESSTDMQYSDNEQEIPDSSRSAHKRR